MNSLTKNLNIRVINTLLLSLSLVGMLYLFIVLI